MQLLKLGVTSTSSSSSSSSPAGVSARVFQRVTAAGEGFTSFALIFLKSVPGSFATDDEMTLN